MRTSRAKEARDRALAVSLFVAYSSTARYIPAKGLRILRPDINAYFEAIVKSCDVLCEECETIANVSYAKAAGWRKVRLGVPRK